MFFSPFRKFVHRIVCTLKHWKDLLRLFVSCDT